MGAGQVVDSHAAIGVRQAGSVEQPFHRVHEAGDPRRVDANVGIPEPPEMGNGVERAVPEDAGEKPFRLRQDR